MSSIASTFLHLVNITKGWRNFFILYVVLACVLALSELALVAVVADFLSFRFNGDSKFPDLYKFYMGGGGIIIFLAILVALIRVLFTYSSGRISFSLGKEVLQQVFSRILNRPFGDSSDKKESQLAFLTSKVDMVVHGLILPCLNIVSGFIIGVVFILFLLATSIELTLFAILVLSIGYMVPTFFSNARLKRSSVLLAHQLTALVNNLKTGIFADRDIRLWGMETFFQKTVSNSSSDIAKVREFAYLWSLVPKILIEASIYISIGVLLIVSTDSLEQSAYVYITFGLASLKLLPVIQQIYYGWTHLKVGRQITKELNFYLSDSAYFGSSANPETAFLSLTMRNIYYGYGKDNRVLNSFQLTILANEKLAIYGESGAGKSTIMDLISGLVKPDLGEVIINDSILEHGSLNPHVAYISQSPFIFNRSIADNVTLAFNSGDKVDNARLEKALTASGVQDYMISNNLLSDYIVGENGSYLSGGQAQRLAIARALYSRKDILLLDEITSALDSDTSKRIIDSVLNVSATVVLITHDKTIYSRFPKKLEVKKLPEKLSKC